jgi:SAM-dependent methyltransferase
MPDDVSPISLNAEAAVRARYAAGAAQSEAALCCPVDYDPQYLRAIPAEVIERDYGCGDPSRYLRAGETVLDLGSGTGKICFIAAQIVGPAGQVIGVDMTEEMLEVARRNAPVVAANIGYENVTFRRGRIQDLALDVEAMDAALRDAPVNDWDGLVRAEAVARSLRANSPMIPDASIDVVVSNCVLNLVESGAKADLFKEIYRVLRKGGRAVISDIVADEPVPAHLQDDPALWSGCISGAFTESGFLQAFEDAGFHGMQVLKLDSQPWQTVEGIEFRAVTVVAYKGKAGPCFERNQAVIYQGPFKQVLDDDGHLMERGKRYAVCDKTYQLYRQEPYAGMFAHIEPLVPVALEDAGLFDCTRTALRHPRETKGLEYAATTAAAGDCCGPEGCC